MEALRRARFFGCGEEPTQISREKDWDIMMWYWDVLLPCAAMKEFWGKKTRYNAILSDEELCASGRQIITPSTEAFAFVCYENNLDKWEAAGSFMGQFLITAIDC